MPGLTKGLLFIKVTGVAPLMGLLGTVTGMIKTFQVITLYGAGDPKMMAGGISQALMTTVLGLCRDPDGPDPHPGERQSRRSATSCIPEVPESLLNAERHTRGGST